MKKFFSLSLVCLLALSPNIVRAGFLSSCPIPGNGFQEKMKTFMSVAGTLWVVAEVGYRRLQKLNKPADAAALKENPAGYIREAIKEVLVELDVATQEQVAKTAEAVMKKRHPELSKDLAAHVMQVMEKQAAMATKGDLVDHIEKAISGLMNEEAVKACIAAALNGVVKQQQVNTMIDQKMLKEAQIRNWIEEAMKQINPEMNLAQVREIAREVAMEVLRQVGAQHEACAAIVQ